MATLYLVFVILAFTVLAVSLFWVWIWSNQTPRAKAAKASPHVVGSETASAAQH